MCVRWSYCSWMLRLLLLNMVALGREPSSGSHSMPPSLSFSTPQRTSVFRPYIPMLNGSSYPAGSKAPGGPADGKGYSVRIPSIATNNGTVVAFVEGWIQGCELSPRPNITCAKDILTRRSEHGGVAGSWAPVAVAVSALSIAGDERDSLTNPSPVFERQSGALYLLFNRAPAALNTIESLELDPYARETWVVRSVDGGRSFQKPHNITHVQDRTWTWCAVSPGAAAVQLDGGRIVVPGYHIRNRPGMTPTKKDWGVRPMYGHTIISEDRGRTWRRGIREGPLNVDENQLAPLPDGLPCVGTVCPGSTKLLLNARNDGDCDKPETGPGSGRGCRLSAISTDGGDSYGAAFPVPTLPEHQPTSGGLVRFGPYIFFSGVESNNELRYNITLRFSVDDGRTYRPQSLLLREGTGEYSALTVVPVLAEHFAFDILCLEYSPYEAGVHSSDVSLVRVHVAVQNEPSPSPWPNPARCHGELLSNGICLPTRWPPRRNYTREYTKPPYLQATPEIINITKGRQLFVDDFLIELSQNVNQTFHSAVPSPFNPVLRPTRSWEQGVALPFSGGLWWDPVPGLYKIWYSCGVSSNTTCFATSTDGIHFHKPDLGNGRNIVTGSGEHDGNVVWLDHEEPNPARRFKIAEVRRCKPSSRRCDFRHFTLLSSADGTNWSTVVTQSGVLADRSTFFQDRIRNKFIYSIKTDPSATTPSSGGVNIGRARAYREATDFFRDSQWLGIPSIPYGAPYDRNGTNSPVPWTASDVLDPHLLINGHTLEFRPELYNLDAVSYESLTVGLLSILSCKHADDSRCPGPDSSHEFNQIFAAFTRNGFDWSRPPAPRTPLAPLDLRGCSLDAERCKNFNFEDSQSVGGGFVVHGDTLRIYVSGRTNEMQNSAVGFFILRRDGFASLAPLNVRATAFITTKLVFWSEPAERYLFVNFDPGDGGELFVAVLDEAGDAIAPFTTQNCIPVQENSTRAQVRWKNDEALPKGRAVRFQFTWGSSTRSSTPARLFSFWVSPSSCGESNGFVAAGGPGSVHGMDIVGACEHPPLPHSKAKTDDAAARTSYHLKWSTIYDTDFPAMQGWINMGMSIYNAWPPGCKVAEPGVNGCGLRAKLTAYERFNITSFYDLCDHPSSARYPPNITNQSAPWSEDGYCAIWQRGVGLIPGWEAALETQVAHQIAPHFGPGKALRGVFLGDELCCWVTDCWNRQLSRLATKLRSLLGPDAILYSNECIPRLVHGGNASWDAVRVPKALNLISVDIYAGYHPSAPGNSGSEEVEAVKQQYETGLLPRLHPGQQAMVVPGMFGCSNTSWWPLEKQERLLEEKLSGYWAWMQKEQRIGGMAPWHWANRNTPGDPRNECDMQLGASDFPRVVVQLQRMGKAIIDGVQL